MTMTDTDAIKSINVEEASKDELLHLIFLSTEELTDAFEEFLVAAYGQEEIKETIAGLEERAKEEYKELEMKHLREIGEMAKAQLLALRGEAPIDEIPMGLSEETLEAVQEIRERSLRRFEEIMGQSMEDMLSENIPGKEVDEAVASLEARLA